MSHDFSDIAVTGVELTPDGVFVTVTGRDAGRRLLEEIIGAPCRGLQIAPERGTGCGQFRLLGCGGSQAITLDLELPPGSTYGVSLNFPAVHFVTADADHVDVKHRKHVATVDLSQVEIYLGGLPDTTAYLNDVELSGLGMFHRQPAHLPGGWPWSLD